MARCRGPRAAGIQWNCDMEHGVVDGRCTDCQIMAEAGSNLSREQIDAVRDAITKTPCAHPDEHLTIEEHAINCMGCGQRWLQSPPSAYVVRRSGYREVFHPDDVELVYEDAGVGEGRG